MSDPVHVDQQAHHEMDLWMSGRIDAGDPGAQLAVSLHREVPFSKAYGMADLERSLPLTAHSQLDAGSVIKVLTGLAVAMLEEDGALPVETKLRDVLPDFPAYGSDLRIKHLLHHESGLRNYTVLLYYMTGWHEQAPPSSDEVYASICRAGSLGFEPGSKYEYCDSNYFLLARIIEYVTSSRFGAFIEKRILRPLGMASSVIVDDVSLDLSVWAQGYVSYPSKLRSPHAYRSSSSDDGFYPARLRYTHVGAEGLRTTAQDLLILGQHLMGPSDVLSAPIRERVLCAPRMRDDGFGYAYGLNVGTFRGMRFFGHSGEIQGFTATMTCFPDENLSIACLTNRQDVSAWACRNYVLDRLVGPRSASRALNDICREQTTWSATLAGFYLDPISATALEISVTDGELGVCLGGGPVSALSGSGPWHTQGGLMILCAHAQDMMDEARPSLIVHNEHVASVFVPFIEHIDQKALAAYEGVYTCDALATSFRVEAVLGALRLTNQDVRCPSMDLDYTPTIKDFFWSHDPHPVLSQLQFLREESGIGGFVYRDADGDRREDFRFVRVSS